MIKKIFMLIFLFIFVSFNVYGMTFTWTSNTESDLAGYNLYQRTDTTEYVVIENNISKDINFLHKEDPVDLGTYYWVLTAFDESGNESGYSNEVTYTFEDKTPPNPPINLDCEPDNVNVDVEVNVTIN